MDNSGGGIGFAGLLVIVFIVLKLCGVIDWSWVWVLSPIWISLALVIIIIVLYWLIKVTQLSTGSGGKESEEP